VSEAIFLANAAGENQQPDPRLQPNADSAILHPRHHHHEVHDDVRRINSINFCYCSVQKLLPYLLSKNHNDQDKQNNNYVSCFLWV
jgi:hypothetical protein